MSSLPSIQEILDNPDILADQDSPPGYDSLNSAPALLGPELSRRLVESSTILDTLDDKLFRDAPTDRSRLRRHNQLRRERGLNDTFALPDRLQAKGAGDVLSQEFGTAGGLTEKLPIAGTALFAKDLFQMAAAAKRIEDGSADGSDYALIADYLDRIVEESQRTTTGGTIASILSDSLPFALELGISGGVGTVVRGGLSKAAREAAEKLAKREARKLSLRALGRAATTALPVIAIQTPESFARRRMPDIAFTQDDQEALEVLIRQDAAPVWEALRDGLVDTSIEVGSEMTGPVLGYVGGKGAKGLLKVIRVPVERLDEFVPTFKAALAGELVNRGVVKTYREAVKRLNVVGFHGATLELGEEVLGEVARDVARELGAEGVGPGLSSRLDPERPLESVKKSATEFAAFMVPGAGATAVWTALGLKRSDIPGQIETSPEEAPGQPLEAESQEIPPPPPQEEAVDLESALDAISSAQRRASARDLPLGTGKKVPQLGEIIRDAPDIVELINAERARNNLPRLTEAELGELPRAPESHFIRVAGRPLKTGQAVQVTLYRGYGRGVDQSVLAEGVEEAALGSGEYFALDREVAKQYGPKVETRTVELDNPIVIDSDSQLAKLMGAPSVPLDNDKRIPLLRRVRESLEKQGYDSAVIHLGSGDLNREGKGIKRLREIFGDSQVVIFGPPQAVEARESPLSLKKDELLSEAGAAEVLRVAPDVAAAIVDRRSSGQPLTRTSYDDLRRLAPDARIKKWTIAERYQFATILQELVLRETGQEPALAGEAEREVEDAGTDAEERGVQGAPGSEPGIPVRLGEELRVRTGESGRPDQAQEGGRHEQIGEYGQQDLERVLASPDAGRRLTQAENLAVAEGLPLKTARQAFARLGRGEALDVISADLDLTEQQTRRIIDSLVDPSGTRARITGRSREDIERRGRGLGGRLYSTPLDPELLKALADFVAKAVKAGVKTLAELLDLLEKRFGAELRERFRPHVEKEFKRLTEARPQEQPTSAPTHVPQGPRPDLANIGTTAEGRAMVDEVTAAMERTVRADKEVQAAARARIAADPQGELERSLAGRIITDVDKQVAIDLFNDLHRSMTKEGKLSDPESLEQLQALLVAYRMSQTETARALRIGRDHIAGPEERAQALREATTLPSAQFRELIAKIQGDLAEARSRVERERQLPEPTTRKATTRKPETGPTRAERKVKTLEDKLRAAIRRAAKKTKNLHRKLKRLGFDVEKIEEIAKDGRRSHKMLNQIHALQSDSIDVAQEIFRNDLVSGLHTLERNMIGNFGHAAWYNAIERPVEAVVNLLVRSPDAAQLAELKYMFAGMWPAVCRGCVNAWKSFDLETPYFERTLGVPIEEAEAKLDIGRGIAISGSKGRIVRFPQNAFLLAPDEFSKTILTNMNAGMIAYRQAKAAGLKGEALQKHMADNLSDTSNPVWTEALAESRMLLFQEKLGPVGSGIQDFLRSNRLLKFFAMFVQTGSNLLKQGAKRTPLGMVSLTRKILEAQKTGDWSKVPREVALQLIFWSMVLALWPYLDPDDPYITGTIDRKKKGIREAESRGAISAKSIKVMGIRISYDPVEPYSTSLSMLVDGVLAFRREGTIAALESSYKSFLRNMRSKTYLQGFSDLLRLLEGDLPLDQWAVRFTTSWMPNIVKQSSRSLTKDYVPERRIWGRGTERGMRTLRRFGQGLEVGIIADEPQFDLYGRRIPFDHPLTDFPLRLANLAFPFRFKRERRILGPDRALVNWNNQNPGAEYWPEVPGPSITLKSNKAKRGTRVYFTDEQKSLYVQLRGLLYWDSIYKHRFNVDKPTREDIEVMTKAMRAATQEAKGILWKATDRKVFYTPDRARKRIKRLLRIHRETHGEQKPRKPQ